jgi:DNA repair protein RecO (recombination protein O)
MRPAGSGLSGSPAESGALVRAFVLHRRDFGDTSLLLELLALGLGRLPAIAKGARRGRSPSGAVLQPFQPLWVGLVGRGEVRTLTRAEAAGRPLALTGRALPCGFYLNELLMRLLGRHDPHDPLFAFYHAALAGLAGGGPIESALRQFELRLLEELGYAPDLHLDAGSGEPVEPGRRYRVDPGQGPQPVFEGVAEGPDPGVSGATLLALAEGGALDPAQAREARALLRGLLDPHLGPKPLKSRELFRRWQGDGRR